MAGKVKFNPEAAFQSIIGGGDEATSLPDVQTTEPKKKASVGRPKVARETKKKRVSFALYPSSYEKLQKIAYVKRQSISDIVSKLIATYVEDNAADLEEYDKIQSK